jgi:hypothetical protein
MVRMESSANYKVNVQLSQKKLNFDMNRIQQRIQNEVSPIINYNGKQ